MTPYVVSVTLYSVVSERDAICHGSPPTTTHCRDARKGPTVISLSLSLFLATTYLAARGDDGSNALPLLLRFGFKRKEEVRFELVQYRGLALREPHGCAAEVEQQRDARCDLEQHVVRRSNRRPRLD